MTIWGHCMYSQHLQKEKSIHWLFAGRKKSYIYLSLLQKLNLKARLPQVSSCIIWFKVRFYWKVCQTVGEVCSHQRFTQQWMISWADIPSDLNYYQKHNVYTMLKPWYQYWQICSVKWSLFWMNSTEMKDYDWV